MPTTTHVIIVRHGQSQGNAEGRFGGHTDTPLSTLGRKQADATAKALASERLNAVYTSDLRRAIETAKPLADLTRAPLVTTNSLRERSVGVMEGLTFAEAAAQHPEQYQALLQRDFEHVLLGGESYRQMLERAAAKLDETIQKHRGGRIVLFTHTGTICILILHLMGALDSPNLKPIWIATQNCGLARFDLRSDGFVRVLAINDTRHLAKI